MGDTITCSSCGKDIESADDVETAEVQTMEHDEEDDSFNLYGDRTDLFLCDGCSEPLGVGRRN